MCDDFKRGGFSGVKKNGGESMCHWKFWLILLFWIAPVALVIAEQPQQHAGDYPITPVPPTSVQVDDGFWKHRID